MQPYFLGACHYVTIMVYFFSDFHILWIQSAAPNNKPKNGKGYIKSLLNIMNLKRVLIKTDKGLDLTSSLLPKLNLLCGKKNKVKTVKQPPVSSELSQQHAGVEQRAGRGALSISRGDKRAGPTLTPKHLCNFSPGHSSGQLWTRWQL